jgi:hypothetical protein
VGPNYIAAAAVVEAVVDTAQVAVGYILEQVAVVAGYNSAVVTVSGTAWVVVARRHTSGVQ